MISGKVHCKRIVHSLFILFFSDFLCFKIFKFWMPIEKEITIV